MIRTADAADFGAIYHLVCRLEDRTLPKEAFYEILTAQLADPAHCFLLAETAGQPAGLLHLRIEAQLHHAGQIAEILELIVDAPFRGQGLGESLIRAACRCARERGCLQLEAACNLSRTASHLFYERQGMARTHYKFSKLL